MKTNGKWKEVAGLLVFTIIFSAHTFKAQICGIKTVGPAGDYPTLTAAFGAASAGLCGNLVFELQPTYTSGSETLPLSVPVTATSVNTITIRPQTGATGLSITGSNASAILDFNGAGYVTFDGRPGGLGSSKELVIENTLVAASGAVIRFINGSSTNTISYCIVKGAETSFSSGVILFSTSTAINGNSFNTIDHCDVRDGVGTPANGIFSLGTPGKNNTGNTISNSNVYNFHHPSAACGGVRVVTNNSSWTIAGNSFYQTVPRNSSSAAYTVIQVSASSGNNFIIRDNYIGGSAPGAAGTYSITCASFKAISFSANVSAPSSVDNNTITNISYTSVTNNNLWTGIAVSNGLVNIGSVAGNTIGNAAGNGAIIINNAGAPNGTSYGIQAAGTSTVNISNNLVGAITLNGTAAFPNTFKAISSACPGLISGNAIGSASTASSIQNNAYSGTQPVLIFGIESSATPVTVSGNTIANILNRATSSSVSNQIMGITSVPSGNNSVTISGNTVRDLSSASANNSPVGGNIPVCGIYTGGAGTGVKTISDNSVYNLSNSNAFNDINIAGIVFNNPAPGNIIEKNRVHSLQLSTLSTLAGITGIGILDGSSIVKNNMVSLGLGITGSSITNTYAIKGMIKSPPVANAFYFNSILVGGVGVATNATNTAAFENSNVVAGDTIKNNIFVNNRSNAGSGGIHYAVIPGGISVLDYNAYYYNGTGGVLGNAGGIDYATLSLWKAGTGMDASSVFADPHFISNTDLHINTLLYSDFNSNAAAIHSITTDIDGDLRPGFGELFSDIGADEFDGTLALKDVGAIALTSPAAPACYTASETVRIRIKNFNAYDVNFSSVPVTVNCSVTGINAVAFPALLLNSGTLAAGATLDTAITTSYDMSAFGVHTFFASTSVTGDNDPSNDTMQPVTIDNTMNASSDATVCAGSSSALTVTGSDSYLWAPSSGLNVVTGAVVNAGPLSTTTYTVTGTCGNTATITVNVNQLPVLAGSGDTSVCSGNSVNLSVAGADSYAWSPSAGLNLATGANVIATPLVTNTYTITGTGINQCVSNRLVNIYVNQSPASGIDGDLAVCSGSSTVLSAATAASYLWSTQETTQAILVSLPGNYSVTVSDNDCHATASAYVTTKSNPAITTSGNHTMCEGAAPAALCAGGGGALTSSLRWSPSAGLSSAEGACVYANPLVTTTYTIYGSGANGCSDTAGITVFVNPLPTVSVDGELTICRGAIASLTANGAPAYIWTPADHLSSPADAIVYASPLHTTLYSVTGVLDGCSKTESFVLVIESCTGITEESQDNHRLSVFPNPGSGIINVHIAFDGTENFTVRLINLRGELIYSETKYEYTGVFQTILDMGREPKGVYLLQLLTNKEITGKKIILE